jgi:hypothetical protein
LAENGLFKVKELRSLTTTVYADGKEFIEVGSHQAKAGYLVGFADSDFIGESFRFS